MEDSAADNCVVPKNKGKTVTALLLLISSLMNAAGTLQQLVLGQVLELSEGFAFLSSRSQARQLRWCSSAFTSAGLLRGGCRQAVVQFALSRSKVQERNKRGGKKT